MTFQEFNLKPELQSAIDKAGFTEPSPVQQEAIPPVLEGKDIVAQAHTGTGKTAAFGLPVLNMLERNGTVEMVVIVPTRELAVQVSDELFKFGKFLNINTATVYGGQSYTRQLKHIDNASIIVATPGRFLDLLKGSKGKDMQINIDPKYVVLDEADEMLDMGFLEDIKQIFTFFKGERQTLMFSATMPPPIRTLAQKILKEPVFINITKGVTTNAKISQSFYVIDERERDEALIRLLDFKNPTKSIIFCRMKIEVDRLVSFLNSQGYTAKGLHGDMEQRQREDVIRVFKKDQLEILIATDVAARGLDVNNVSHVFNYQIPFDSESYVHRIGRTGRGGKDGTAASLVTTREFHSLSKIKKMAGENLVAKAIPNIESVQKRKTEELITKVNSIKVVDQAQEIVDRLLETNDLETVAHMLASIVSKESNVYGRNQIGRTLDDIEYLLSRQRNDRGGRNGGGRNSRGGGYRGGNRNGGGGHRGGRNGGSHRGGSRDGNRSNRG